MHTRLAMLLVLVFGSLATAQDLELKPRAIFLRATDGATLQEYNLQQATFALDDVLISPSASYGWSFNSANTELIDYLANGNIRKQLEFTDDQNKEFKSLQKEFSQAFKDLYAKYPELKKKDLPADERKKLNETVILKGKKLRQEFSEKVKETLIPHQVSMVKTLKFKQAVQMFGFSHALTKSRFAEELKTTDEQKKEIEKIRRESQAAINKKIEEMKAEAKEKMIQVLDSKQKKTLKELQGDAKETKPRF